jgi:hypothetical protein
VSPAQSEPYVPMMLMGEFEGWPVIPPGPLYDQRKGDEQPDALRGDLLERWLPVTGIMVPYRRIRKAERRSAFLWRA